jgi:hypothetical protein
MSSVTILGGDSSDLGIVLSCLDDVLLILISKSWADGVWHKLKEEVPD